MNTYLVCLIFLGALVVDHGDASCPKSWTSRGNKCYQLIGKAANRATQKQNCENLGGYLAQPTSQCENNFLGSFIKGTSFIGFNDMKEECKWVSDTSGKSVVYTNWARGEPNDYNGNEDCAEMYHRSGLWNDIFCTHNRQAVCERKECPKGFTPGSQKCYKVFTTSKSYNSAKASCKNLGAHLAEPLSSTENADIAKLIKRTSFTGFNDMKKEQTWVRNTNGKTLTYKNWAPREPNDFRPGEDCSEMYNGGKWNDIFCTVKRGYVCEI